MAGEGLSGATDVSASSSISSAVDPSQVDQYISGPQQGNQEPSGQQPRAPEQQGNAQEPQPFFDASKVPPENQASFREMQAAWTKKTQALGNLNRTIEELGGIEEVTPFLEQFTTTEGTLDWFVSIAEQLGPDGIQQVLSQAGIQGDEGYGGQYEQGGYEPEPYEQEAPYGLGDDNEPLTRAEFNQLMQQQQMQQQMAQEDQEVRTLMDKLQIPEDVRDVVAQIASRQPEYLGYHKRLERGYQQFQDLVEQQSASILEKRQANTQRLPQGGPVTGGSAPAGGSQAPKDFSDASAAARQYLNSVGAA